MQAVQILGAMEIASAPRDRCPISRPPRGRGRARAPRAPLVRGLGHGGRRLPPGAADQRRSRRCRRATAATRRCSTARATCRATCGCCARSDGAAARHRGRRAVMPLLRHLTMYKVGREVTIDEVTEGRDGDLGDRPGRGRGRARRAGRARALPPCGDRRRRRVPRGHDGPRGRPDRPARRSARGARPRWTTAGAEPVRRGRRRDRAGRERPTALRTRDDDRNDPPGGGDQRARRELHQGLLHRPGDRRPPALQGQAEPPPARPAARSGRSPPAIPCGWASASSGRSARPSSPPLAGRSRSRSCAARPSRAPR